MHWAHRAARRFPDGQLYLNLRGYAPGGAAVQPAEAVRGFLETLGVPPHQIPVSEQAQMAMYRSLLAGRRMLVVLDNARDSEHLRPLLPGTSGCMVVATSRNALGGLVATEGAYLLTLDLLSQAEAGQLLARRLGPQRTAAEPRATDEIVQYCARLPLALVIVAARAAAYPDRPLAALAAGLSAARGSLDALDGGEEATDLRAVFSWSYRGLGTGAARLFRLLGVYPGPEATVPAAASLVGVPTRQAQALLAELARAHLVAEHLPGRYTFHDLLHAYATELAKEREAEEAWRAALTRAFDYHLAATAAAMDVLMPAEQYRRPAVPATATPLPALPSAAAARGWLNEEWATLLAVVEHAATRGWPEHAIRLAAAMFRYLDIGGHYADARRVHTYALHAAQQTGDRSAQAQALINLCGVDWWQGQYAQADELGDLVQQALAHDGLARTYLATGDADRADSHWRRALAIFHALGLPETDRVEAGLRTVTST